MHNGARLHGQTSIKAYIYDISNIITCTFRFEYIYNLLLSILNCHELSKKKFLTNKNDSYRMIYITNEELLIQRQDPST